LFDVADTQKLELFHYSRLPHSPSFLHSIVCFLFCHNYWFNKNFEIRFNIAVLHMLLFQNYLHIHLEHRNIWAKNVFFSKSC